MIDISEQAGPIILIENRSGINPRSYRKKQSSPIVNGAAVKKAKRADFLRFRSQTYGKMQSPKDVETKLINKTRGYESSQCRNKGAIKYNAAVDVPIANNTLFIFGTVSLR